MQAPAPPALSYEQLDQLRETRRHFTKVRRAIAAATFDAYATAIFAAITMLGSLFSFSLPAFVLGIIMTIVTLRSFIGRARLKRFDESAFKFLAYNQLLFGAGLIIYGLWNMYRYAHGPAPFAEVIAQEPET